MNKELGILVKSDKVMVSSLDVADNFKKRRDNVVKSIREMKCSEEFRLLNFKESSYVNFQNKKMPMYLMTRDGFTLLAMGYTGKMAMEFKEKYIAEFNKMESFIREKQSKEWLQTRKSGKLTRRNETDKLKLLLEYAVSNGSETYFKQPNRLYSQYTKLINSSVGIITGERENCVWKVLITIQMLEDMVQNTVVEEIAKETDYHDIYKICKERCKEMTRYAYLPEQKLLN